MGIKRQFCIALESGLFPALVTICTKCMAGFATRFRALQHISKRPGNTFCKAVALLLCFPCCKLSNFFFKLTYTLNQLELVRLGGHCARLGGDDFFLEFNDLFLNFSTDLKLQQTCSDVRPST